MTIEPAKEPVVAREPAVEAELAPARSAVDALLRDILRDVLALEADLVGAFTDETGLFGHLPELDSMAVASLFTEMEDRLGIIIEDDDVDGELLETYGGLLAFAQVKVIIGHTDGGASN